MIGGSLAGMAAAARLAKAGHTVRLLEKGPTLGGRLASDGAMPAVLEFPAPWRDLFRKSGRPLEAELTRSGLSLVPAPPACHRFADQTELVLPTERGEQESALSRAYGPGTARQWRDMLDKLDETMQILRPLGQESELHDQTQLSRNVRKRLRYRHTIEGLARSVDEPHLAAVIRSVATRLGSEPRQTPAWCAVQLTIERAFGRWLITGCDGPVEATRLVQLLAARIELRKVDVVYGAAVTKIIVDDSGSARGVAVADEKLPADAVICATNPWHCYGDLLDQRWATGERQALHRVRPALVPTVTCTVLGSSAAPISHPTPTPIETVIHSDTLDMVGFELPHPGGQTLQISHDYTRARPDPSAGIAWRGPRSWLYRPPIRSSVDRLFLAGPHSRGGAGIPQTILSGALASYACHDLLSAG